MSDDSTAVEFARVYDKLDKVIEVVTANRLETEKLRGDMNVMAANLAPISTDVRELKSAVSDVNTRMDKLERQSSFNAGRKLAWAGFGTALMLIINVCIILIKELVLK